MTLFQAILWLDHADAQLIHFDRERAETRRIKAGQSHLGGSGQNGRRAHRDGPETAYFSLLVQAVADTREILIVGPSTAKSELMRFIEARHPQLARRVVAVEAMDHPSESQMLAYARSTFDRIERMRAIPAALV
jgi:stalled ribosome rescue protein Dom34